jgi:glycosyltransferase involved in cell wall biosynthesis
LRILIAIGVRREREAGAAGVALNHARELGKRGHEVDCWFLEDIFEKPASSKRFEALIFANRVAKRILREPGKYDVVNLHAPWGCVYGIRRKFSGAGHEPPYVMTMQGSEERFAYAMKAEHRKGRAANFSWKNRVWHRLYHQTLYDYAIATCDYGAVAAREGWICAELKYGRPFGRVRYVPNGVEQQFFAPHDYAGKMPLRLLYVGTWLDRKGVYYLADCFNALVRSNIPVTLTVAGCGGTEEYVKNFFAPEARERVNVVPFIERAKMPAVYAEHDVFVFPSLVEGMPLTLLEAMAAGMPVVTTASSGMADVVEDGYNGLLVAPADGEALASAVSKLVGDEGLRGKLGKEGQSTMRRYTWERVTAQLEEILVLAASRAKKERN